jgi:hypothetical protein
MPENAFDIDFVASSHAPNVAWGCTDANTKKVNIAYKPGAFSQVWHTITEAI